MSCDPLIRARFGPTVGHINLQLQQQADASNLAMYTRVYAHIHIHTYVWAIYKHTHTHTFFPLISLCPLSVVLVRSSLAWIIFQCQKFVPPFEKLKSVLMATATATATALAMKINGLPLPVSSFPVFRSIFRIRHPQQCNRWRAAAACRFNLFKLASTCGLIWLTAVAACRFPGEKSHRVLD